jgi:hypothetical protein
MNHHSTFLKMSSESDRKQRMAELEARRKRLEDFKKRKTTTGGSLSSGADDILSEIDSLISKPGLRLRDSNFCHHQSISHPFLYYISHPEPVVAPLGPSASSSASSSSAVLSPSASSTISSPPPAVPLRLGASELMTNQRIQC